MAVQKPKISIEDPFLREKINLEGIRNEFRRISESFKFYNTIVIAVFLLGFLILFFTLATILFQAWQFNNIFQNESNQLKIQEDIIKNDVIIQQQLLNKLNR